MASDLVSHDSAVKPSQNPMRRAKLSLSHLLLLCQSFHAWGTRSPAHATMPFPKSREDRSSFTWDLAVCARACACEARACAAVSFMIVFVKLVNVFS